MDQILRRLVAWQIRNHHLYTLALAVFVICLVLWFGPLGVRMIRRHLRKRAAPQRRAHETLALQGE